MVVLSLNMNNNDINDINLIDRAINHNYKAFFATL